MVYFSEMVSFSGFVYFLYYFLRCGEFSEFGFQCEDIVAWKDSFEVTSV